MGLHGLQRAGGGRLKRLALSSLLLTLAACSGRPRAPLALGSQERLWSYENDFDTLGAEQAIPPRWTLMSLSPTGFHPAWGPAPGKESRGFGFFGTLPSGEGRTQAMALFEGGRLRPPFSLSVEVRGERQAAFGLFFSFRSVTDFEAVERGPEGLRSWRRKLGETQLLFRRDLPPAEDRWHLLRVDRLDGWLRVRWDQERPILLKLQGRGHGLMGLMARGGAVSFENLRVVQGRPEAFPLFR